jgi:hypothetical protein
MSEKSDFGEDDRILARLEHKADVEAFTNLMAHAHQLGLSAADFVRQEPKRTSRKIIRKLCLENQKRSLKMLVVSILEGLWDRPASDQTTALGHPIYGPPPASAKTEANGKARKAPFE